MSVQWGPVESCVQNITGYSVRYGEVETSERTVVEMVSGDSSGGMTTISGLTKETVYTVEVAVETSAGTGVYSHPLIFQTPDSERNLHNHVHTPYFILFADVFLSLNGVVIPNHGYVNISDIGTDDSALLCHTTHPGIHEPEGHWFAPDGTRVFVDDVPGFKRSRGPMVVRLNKHSGTDQPEGIYKCTIKREDSKFKRIFVGLYFTAGMCSLCTTLISNLN